MKIILALGIMLAINVMLFLGQTAVDNVAQEYGFSNPTTLIDGNALINKYNTGNNVLNSSYELPETEASIDSDNNNFFIDPIGSLKSWGNSIGDGFNFFSGIINAVPNFLKNIGLPNEISFALGFFWHVLTLFLVIMLIWGRQL